jgi:hypothetical protein
VPLCGSWSLPPDCKSRLAVSLVKLAAALGGLIPGVHHFYDFAAFHLLALPARSYLLAAVADAHAAHLHPGIPHPDLALLPHHTHSII